MNNKAWLLWVSDGVNQISAIGNENYLGSLSLVGGTEKRDNSYFINGRVGMQDMRPAAEQRYIRVDNRDIFYQVSELGKFPDLVNDPVCTKAGYIG